MKKIKEILYRTMLNDGEEYDDRYIFKGSLEDLLKYDFAKLKENDEVEELKHTIKSDEVIYYKKSGLGCFIVFEDKDEIVFYSGVPVWWIGDENKTNYYEDLEKLIKDGLVEKLGNKENE